MKLKRKKMKMRGLIWSSFCRIPRQKPNIVHAVEDFEQDFKHVFYLDNTGLGIVSGENNIE